MLDLKEVIETNRMIMENNLDVRTITMGISLLDCAASTLSEVCDNIYEKITTKAKDLVKVGSVFRSLRSHWWVEAYVTVRRIL